MNSIIRRKRAATRVTTVALLAALSALAACSSGSDGSSAPTGTTGASPREHCLYAAVSAYPTWPNLDQPVVDTIEECRDLSRDDKTQVRQMMVDFVNVATTRAIPE